MAEPVYEIEVIGLSSAGYQRQLVTAPHYKGCTDVHGCVALLYFLWAEERQNAKLYTQEANSAVIKPTGLQ